MIDNKLNNKYYLSGKLNKLYNGYIFLHEKINKLEQSITKYPYFISGPPGQMGPRGIQGPQGPRGVIGPRGVTGPRGATGPTGETGLRGSIGPTGKQGIQGPQGQAGQTVLYFNNQLNSSSSFIFTGLISSINTTQILSTSDFLTVAYTIPNNIGFTTINAIVTNPSISGYVIFTLVYMDCSNGNLGPQLTLLAVTVDFTKGKLNNMYCASNTISPAITLTNSLVVIQQSSSSTTKNPLSYNSTCIIY